VAAAVIARWHAMGHAMGQRMATAVAWHGMASLPTTTHLIAPPLLGHGVIEIEETACAIEIDVYVGVPRFVQRTDPRPYGRVEGGVVAAELSLERVSELLGEEVE